MGTLRRWWDTTFAVELLLLAVAAPILYFPDRFESTEIAFAIGLLGLGWIWRRMMIGVWYQRTPADWAIFFLFCVMLPVSLWAAPGPLREEYAWPKALVLIWNFCLFALIVTHASRREGLAEVSLVLFAGVALAFSLIAPLGTNWLYKLPGVELLLSRFPTMLGELSREGESGFHPNMVAGSILYVLPLMLSVSTAYFLHARRQIVYWLVAAVTLYVLAIFGLMQSRGGYVGLAAAVATMLLIRYRWGRWTLLLGTLAVGIALIFGSSSFLEVIADAPVVNTVGGTATLEDFRVELWSATLYAINDFAFTGSGLGALQGVLPLLYPMNIAPDYYFGHAHNFWLQNAVDFGVPGLIAILAIYVVAGIQLQQLWRSQPVIAGAATGLIGCIVAQSVFSMTDSVSMGSTPNLLFWLLFALIFGLSTISQKAMKQA